MNQIATFEKVSFEQYREARQKLFNLDSMAGLYQEWDSIKPPIRATSGSAGYDFFLPFGCCFNREPITIPTGIRVNIDPGWFLMCAPKSGLGFKYRMKLANTIGIIDSDYYFSTNEGHIMAKINSKESFYLDKGDKFMQGMLLPYGIAKDDICNGVRDGGFGSTGR